MPIINLPTPSFNPGDNAIMFRAGDINKLQQNQYLDTGEYFQEKYGIYTNLRLTSDSRYRIQRPKSNFMKWQAHNSCGVTPTRGGGFDDYFINPERVVIREEICYDEFFESIFSALLEWDSSMDAPEISDVLLQELFDAWMRDKSYGDRVALAMGSVFDADGTAFAEGSSAEKQAAFTQTHEANTGWVKILIDAAAGGVTNARIANAFGANFTDGQYTGDVLDLIDTVKSNAMPALKRLINSGGVFKNGVRYGANLVVSDSVYAQLSTQYITEGANAATNAGGRIKAMETTGNAVTRPALEYWVDGLLPVIPLSELSAYDEILEVNTHFCGIVASGVIQEGANFDVARDADKGGSVIIEKVSSLAQSNYGGYMMGAHGLLGAAIADTDLVSCAIEFA